MQAQTPSKPGGIPSLIRSMAADMGMSDGDLCHAAAMMIAAATLPAPEARAFCV